MVVLVLGVLVTMGMHMLGAVGVHVFVLVKDDFDLPPEGVRYAAQRFQTGEMVAAFQSGNHGFSHSEARCQLFLCFGVIDTQIQQLSRALGRKFFAVERSTLMYIRLTGRTHGLATLANMLTLVKT